jgi:hypothetical protein
LSKFFVSPDGSERIPFPETLTQDSILNSEALTCWLYVSHVTGLPLRDFVSKVLLEAYDTEGEGLIVYCEARDRWLSANPGKTERDFITMRRRKWQGGATKLSPLEAFKQRITGADEFHASAMGISLS